MSPRPTAPLVLRVDRAVDPVHVARTLTTPSWWLDSARRTPTSGRFSYLGDASGPHAEVLTHRVGEGVTVTTAQGTTHETGTVLDALDRRLRARPVAADVPFGLVGGYVGHLGYECAAELGLDLGLDPRRPRSPVPDALWVRASRYVVIDHDEGCAYVVSDPPDEGWARVTAAAVAEAPAPAPAADLAPAPDLSDAVRAGARRGSQRYEADVEAARALLRAGESWQLCLTDTVALPAPPDDDLSAYARLRSRHPAAYAALLRWPGGTVLSASPERLLAVDGHGHVTSSPIKGTTARLPDPAADDAAARALRADPKAVAENVIIVDLVRNDLSRACTGVHVDPLLAVESTPAVHHLVSTVHGDLRPGHTAVDAVRATFPPGSMTGAPKHRTMQAIGALEGVPRGVYSGAIGYLSGDGAADLSVVIRTAVRTGDVMTVGAGGAVVLDSDPRAELDEMVLKARVAAEGLAP